jgi:CcmD family protein
MIATTAGDSSTSIYIALAVALAVWAGIIFYLWRIDSAVRRLRHRFERLEEQAHHIAPSSPSATLTKVATTPANDGDNDNENDEQDGYTDSDDQ